MVENGPYISKKRIENKMVKIVMPIKVLFSIQYLGIFLEKNVMLYYDWRDITAAIDSKRPNTMLSEAANKT